MEFSFILSSLKLPFTPWPRLSKRRRKRKNSARHHRTQVLRYLLLRGSRVFVSPVVWLQEITLSVPV